MIRELSETLYRITVEDIYLTAESMGRDEAELTPAVVERVAHKIEAMDDDSIVEIIDLMIDDAIDEVAETKGGIEDDD